MNILKMKIFHLENQTKVAYSVEKNFSTLGSKIDFMDKKTYNYMH